MQRARSTIETAPPSGEAALRVSFFIPEEDRPDTLLGLEPDRDWQKMRRKQRWVLQTALRLRDAGCNVEITGRIPSEGMVVYHARHGKHLMRQINGRGRPILVGIRGDNRESVMADFEIVQNGRFHDGERRFFIPYWPQPGLVPRDPRRGERVERIAFKGFQQNLHPDFLSSSWKDWCCEHGLDWVIDTVPWERSEEVGVEADWHDYSDIDVVLAIRPPATRSHERRGHTSKPANKLVNAWLAGVPAVLGEEFAYREAGSPGVDYLESDTLEEAKRSILRLRHEPETYRRIVNAGQAKLAAFQVTAIVREWQSLLYHRIPEIIGRNPVVWSSRRLLGARTVARKIVRLLHARPAR